jgi:hypothetical protein
MNEERIFNEVFFRTHLKAHYFMNVTTMNEPKKIHIRVSNKDPPCHVTLQ